MFSIISTLSVALLAASSASAGLINPHHRAIAHQARAQQPKDWATGYLEDYQVYHARYLAIGCQNKHNTTYFDKCCHPMLATENLQDDRAPDCTPTKDQLASASAAFATSTVQPGPNGEDDCDDGDDEPAAATPAPSSKKVESSSTTKNEAAKATPTPEPESTSSSKKEEQTSTKKDEETTTSKAEETTSSKAEPTTTEKKEEPSSSKTSSTAQATQTKSSSSGSSLGDLIKGGIATFFSQNGVAGACGQVNSDSALIAALQTKTYANGAHCGKNVEITNLKNSKKVTVKVADECPTCNNPQSIDLSTGAFKALGGTVDEGIFDIAWQFV